MDLRFHTLVNVAAVLALSLSANGQTSPISQDSHPVAGAVAYDFQNSGRGSYQARNAAQRLDLEFTPQEAELQYPNASGGLRLTGYGYGQQLQTPADAQLARQGNRVEYLRGDLTEWYVNQADGLEQGFTFASRPTGAKAGEPLVIALAVTGGFTPVLAPASDAVFLHSQAGEALRYGGLHTWDARGREVASRMEVRDREIRLIVDDRDAEYPLVVDPTTTTTTLTATFTACSVSLTTCSIEGDVVTFTAKVAPAPTGAAATELVTIYDGPAVLAIVRLTGGTMTFDTRLLLAGANCLGTGSPGLPCVHSLTAFYHGDGTFLSSLSSTSAPPLLHTIQAKTATTFGPPNNLTAGANAEALVAGAFNLGVNDFPALAVANFGDTPGDVSILVNGPPEGTFTGPTNFSAGRAPRSIAVGYFNSDRFPDLAVVDYAQNVSILLGDGSGTFDTPPPPPILTTGTYPEGIVAADFNGDGNVDLAVSNNGDTPGTVSVFLGKGDGTFQPPVTYPVGLGPSGMAVADFNQDTLPDLAVVNEVDGTVVILLNQVGSPGTFAIESTATTSIGLTANNAESIAVGDFNLDGYPDVAITTVSSTSLGVTVLLNNKAGGFNTPTTYATGAYPNAVAVGDFNGDGVPDLVVSNGYSNTVSILIGKGDGTFPLPAVNYPVGFLPSAIAVGDYNGDGITDLAVANFDSNVSVLSGENVGITASALSTPQSTQINTAFLQPLIVTTTPPTNGVNVLFTAPSTGASGVFVNFDTYVASAVTTGAGPATGTATSPIFFANTIAGSYLATAQLGFGPPVTFSLTNTPGSGVVIKIASNSPASESATVNTPFTAVLPQVPLSVLVTDSGGNPLSGQTVTFTAPSSGPSGTFPGAVTQVQVMTNLSGIATAPTFTANIKAGTYQVIATVAYASTAFTLTNIPGTGFQVVPLTSGESTNVNTSFTNPLAAEVTDQYGNPIGSGVFAYTIIFTVAPGGSGQSATFTSNGLATESDPTNASGIATSSILNANGTAGTYSASASVSGHPSITSASFTLINTTPPAANAITPTSGTPQSATIGTQFATLQVLVTDIHGNGVPGITVTFTAPSSGPSGTFLGSSTPSTNGLGAAAATFVANSIVGTYTVTATVGGVATPAIFVLTNAPGIVLPTLTIPLGATVQFPVTLAQPATRIVYVTLSTGANPTISFNTNTIQFAVGSTTPTYTPEATANSVGPTIVTASAYLYSSVSATETVAP